MASYRSPIVVGAAKSQDHLDDPQLTVHSSTAVLHCSAMSACFSPFLASFWRGPWRRDPCKGF